jgi:hypothetical protein
MNPYGLADGVYEGFSAGEPPHNAGDFHYQGIAARKLPNSEENHPCIPVNLGIYFTM